MDMLEFMVILTGVRFVQYSALKSSNLTPVRITINSSISISSMKRSIVRYNSAVGVGNQCRISLSLSLGRTLANVVISMISKSWVGGGQVSVCGSNIGSIIRHEGTIGVGHKTGLAVHRSHQAKKSQS